MNLNKVHLIGRVTKDVELKKTTTNVSVAKLGLATNNVFVAKDGTKKETAQFHNCVVFGKQADTAAQWIKKGQEIYIEGRIEYRSWEDKDKSKRYITEIIVERFQFGQKAKPKGNLDEASHEDVGPEQVDPGESLEEAIKSEDLPF